MPPGYLPQGPSETKVAVLLRIVFDGKWRLDVLQLMIDGPVRLSALRRAISTCSKKVLIDTLGDLETLGWIRRVEVESAMKRVEYSLTPTWEQQIKKVLRSLGT